MARGERWHGGHPVTGSYTNGQECCDLCANLWSVNTKWSSYVLPSSSQTPECICKSMANEPGLQSGSSEWGRGTCLHFSSRKKRSTTTWNELDFDLINTNLMDKVVKTRFTRQAEETETQLELEMRSYGSQLRYECGLARKFYDEEWEEEYTERWMTCNWNKTWTKYDSLDSCVWTQCLYPPIPPPDAQLEMQWSGDPVEFHENVSYVCAGDDLYFEWDREMTEFNVTCLDDGSWPQPEEWPICLPCRN